MVKTVACREVRDGGQWHAKSVSNVLERALSAKSGANVFCKPSILKMKNLGSNPLFSAAPSARKRRRRATKLPDDSTTKLLRRGMRIGATMMRSGSNLIINAMLIIGIGALLSLGTMLVRSVGTTDKDSQATADITLADLRGTVP